MAGTVEVSLTEEEAKAILVVFDKYVRTTGLSGGSTVFALASKVASALQALQASATPHSGTATSPATGGS